MKKTKNAKAYFMTISKLKECYTKIKKPPVDKTHFTSDHV